MLEEINEEIDIQNKQPETLYEVNYAEKIKK